MTNISRIVEKISDKFNSYSYVVHHKAMIKTMNHLMEKNTFELEHLFIATIKNKTIRKLFFTYDNDMSIELICKLFEEKSVCVPSTKVWQTNDFNEISAHSIDSIADFEEDFISILDNLHENKIIIENLEYITKKEYYCFQDSNLNKKSFSNQYNYLKGVAILPTNNKIFDLFFDSINLNFIDNISQYYTNQIQNKINQYSQATDFYHFKDKIKLSSKAIYQLYKMILPFLNIEKIESSTYFNNLYYSKECIFNENFSLFERKILENYSSILFDAEGTPNQEKALIKNGIIHTTLNDLDCTNKNYSGNTYFLSDIEDPMIYKNDVSNLEVIITDIKKNNNEKYNQKIVEFLYGTNINPENGYISGQTLTYDNLRDTYYIIPIHTNFSKLFEKIICITDSFRYKNMLTPEIIIGFL